MLDQALKRGDLLGKIYWVCLINVGCRGEKTVSLFVDCVGLDLDADMKLWK